MAQSSVHHTTVFGVVPTEHRGIIFYWIFTALPKSYTVGVWGRDEVKESAFFDGFRIRGLLSLRSLQSASR